MTRVRLATLGEKHYLAALEFYLAFLASMQVTTLLLSVLGIAVSRWVACTILLTSVAAGWLNCSIVWSTPCSASFAASTSSRSRAHSTSR